MENELRELPFDEYVRFRNFKLKRIVLLVGSDGTSREKGSNVKLSDAYLQKKGVEPLNAIKISSLEELWSVTLPFGSSMYHFICDLYAANSSETDELLFTILSNMNCSTTICHGMYVKLLEACTYAYFTLHSVSDVKARYEEYVDICSKMLSIMDHAEGINFADVYKDNDLLNEKAELADSIRQSYLSDFVK